MTEKLAIEAQEFTVGREDIKLPLPDDVESSSWGVQQFMHDFEKLNGHQFNIGWTPDDRRIDGSYEIVLPAEAEKPLVVLRGGKKTLVSNSEIGEQLARNNHDAITTRHEWGAILIPPTSAAGFSNFLSCEYSDWAGISSFPGASHWPMVTFKEKLFNDYMHSSHRRLIRRALKETVELLS
ncbi:MAG TPA: hypothetical protein VK712_04005 [Verrucomicrobiae bacterium]|nr:hypothetical protein [Verrucomicrobiae bacterium]